MSKSARTTKASFVYENTSKSTVGEGLLPGRGWPWEWVSGTRRGTEAVWGWKGWGWGLVFDS